MSAKITYQGEDDGPEQVEMHGITFPVGKQVTVSDDVAVRLLGHPLFQRDDKAQAREEAENYAKAQAEAARLDAEKKADKK